jgi:molybdenum cofactor cytidylyltransferase
MGEANKLLQEVRGKPLVRHAVEAQLSSLRRPGDCRDRASA